MQWIQKYDFFLWTWALMMNWGENCPVVWWVNIWNSYFPTRTNSKLPNFYLFRKQRSVLEVFFTVLYGAHVMRSLPSWDALWLAPNDLAPVQWLPCHYRQSWSSLADHSPLAVLETLHTVSMPHQASSVPYRPYREDTQVDRLRWQGRKRYIEDIKEFSPLST